MLTVVGSGDFKKLDVVLVEVATIDGEGDYNKGEELVTIREP